LAAADALLRQRAIRLKDDAARVRYLSVKDHARVRELCRIDSER
jgi:hypothetical protein